MIAIPNMDKPKSCDECVKSLDIECCGDIRNCPLIDIVTCGECKHWHDDGIMTTCDKHIGHGFPSDYFCADGERRSE